MQVSSRQARTIKVHTLRFGPTLFRDEPRIAEPNYGLCVGGPLDVTATVTTKEGPKRIGSLKSPMINNNDEDDKQAMSKSSTSTNVPVCAAVFHECSNDTPGSIEIQMYDGRSCTPNQHLIVSKDNFTAVQPSTDDKQASKCDVETNDDLSIPDLIEPT
ncbi:hypothetical protein BKA93DRAFT_835956 [Sparassis latifolia]